MRYELKRIDSFRAGNIGSLVYGILMTFFAFIAAPIFLIAGMFGGSEAAEPLGIGAVVMLVLYPVMGFVMGWISGFLTSFLYNFIIRWTGGLLFEFENTEAR